MPNDSRNALAGGMYEPSIAASRHATELARGLLGYDNKRIAALS